MELSIQPEYIRKGILSIVVLCLLISAAYGWRAGRDLARSDLAVDQARVVQQSLQYFFADQDRYPSRSEFSDPAVFGPYLSTVPLRSVLSKQCPQPPAYDSLDQRTFTFRYCLPRTFDGQLAGTYTVNQRSIP